MWKKFEHLRKLVLYETVLIISRLRRLEKIDVPANQIYEQRVSEK
jgi:hypothetical protein